LNKSVRSVHETETRGPIYKKISYDLS